VTILAGRPDLIFHLAAIVCGEAEAYFDKGYRINLDATRQIFEAIRAVDARDRCSPRLVFAPSIAVFGGPLPRKLGTNPSRARAPLACALRCTASRRAQCHPIRIAVLKTPGVSKR
jgi:nucleoside-diphosphate-sugar epimerase